MGAAKSDSTKTGRSKAGAAGKASAQSAPARKSTAKADAKKIRARKVRARKVRGGKSAALVLGAADGPEAAIGPGPASDAASAKPALKVGKAKRHAYLVAVEQRRERTRIYAVMAESEAAALAILEPLASAATSLSVVGGLSRDLVRRMKLKAGELRLI